MLHSPGVRARPCRPNGVASPEGGSKGGRRRVPDKAAQGLFFLVAGLVVGGISLFGVVNAGSKRLTATGISDLDSTPLELAALSAFLHGGKGKQNGDVEVSGGRVRTASLVGTGTGDDDLDELDELLQLDEAAPAGAPGGKVSGAGVGNIWDTISALLTHSRKQKGPRKLKRKGTPKDSKGARGKGAKDKGSSRGSKGKGVLPEEPKGKGVLPEGPKGKGTAKGSEDSRTSKRSVGPEGKGTSKGSEGQKGTGTSKGSQRKGSAKGSGEIVTLSHTVIEPKVTETSEETPATLQEDRKGVLANLLKAAAVSLVSELPIPGAPGWARAQVDRVVLSQQHPEAKTLIRGHSLQPLPKQDFDQRFTTCAVVGNSGALLSDSLGASIDQHEAVFRFNDGPTVGFEKYVGSRTTMRMLNNNWAHKWEHSRPPGTAESALVLFGRASARSVPAISNRWPETPVYFLAPEFSAAARTAFKRAQTSLQEKGVFAVAGRNSAPTGVEGVFLALKVCNKVHVYGLGGDSPPGLPYHYHDKVRGVREAHSFEFQNVFLQLLARAGLFELCVPGSASRQCRLALGNNGVLVSEA